MMNNLILYGYLDVYSYFDLSNYESEYYTIATIKNKVFPVKLIYDSIDKSFNFYISVSRDIASAELTNILLKNTKILNGKYLELDKISLFYLSVAGGEVIFPQVKYYNSLILNITSGSIIANTDTTIYIYQNLNEINNIFYNLNKMWYLQIGDIVNIFRINEFLNYEHISISKIREIYSDRIIISNKKVFETVNQIDNNNEYVMVKYEIVPGPVNPFYKISSYFTIDTSIKDIIDYYIRIAAF